MSGPTWYKRNARRALRGMAKLTLEQRGFYQTLQDMIYDEGGPIEDDERHIAGQMMISLRKYRALRDELLELGRIVRSDDGRLFDEACAEVLSEYDEKHEARVVAGRKGGVASGASRAKKPRKRAENELKTSRKSSEFEGEDNKNSDLGEAMLPKKTEYKKLEDDVDDARAREGEAAPKPHPPPTGALWLQRMAEIKIRFGACLDASPHANTAKHLRNLCEPHAGEPCDWERDVWPAIEQVLGVYLERGEMVSSLGVVSKAALRNRDRRLAGNPSIDLQSGEVHVIHQNRSASPTRNNPRAQREARHRAALEVLDEFGRLEMVPRRSVAE